MSDNQTLAVHSNADERPDSLLSRYTRPTVPTRERIESEQDVDATADHGAFGWLRGVRDRAIMLELRRKTGQIKAFGYAWLQSAEFDPSTGIILWFPTATIRLIGRHLNTDIRPNVRLFEGLVRHRVPFVQESDDATVFLASANATVIERIEW